MRLGLPIAFWFMVSFRAERSGAEESLTIIIKGSFDAAFGLAQDDTLAMPYGFHKLIIMNYEL